MNSDNTNDNLSILRNNMKNSYITDRVRNFYEKYNINIFENLYRNVFTNNNDNLNFYDLLSSNIDTKEKLNKIGITNFTDLFNSINIETQLLNNQYELNERIIEARKLIYLYNYLQDFDNILNNQNIFYNLKYISDSLNNALIDSNLSDFELINKNNKEKIIYLENNIDEIINYLLEISKNIPNAKLFIYNQDISSIDLKKKFNQKLLIKAISLGMTLDKLKNKEYEDLNKLVYVPYKRKSIR